MGQLLSKSLARAIILALALCCAVPAVAQESSIVRVLTPADPLAAYSFYDDFLGTNGTPLSVHAPDKGGAWTNLAGTETLTGTGAVQFAGSSNAVTDIASANFTLDADMNSGAYYDYGVYVRYTDASNFTLIDVYHGNWNIEEVKAGTWSTLATTTCTNSNNVDRSISIVANGASISASITGCSTISTSAATRLNAGKAGVANGNASSTTKWYRFTVR